MSKLKSNRSRFIITLSFGVGAIVLIVTGVAFGFLAAQTPQQYDAQARITGPSIVTAKILGGGDTSQLSGVSLSRVAENSVGSTSGPKTNSVGIPLPSNDTGHIRISFAKGTFSNGTYVFLATVTNIGVVSQTIDDLHIGGVDSFGTTVLLSNIIGCTNHGSPFLEPIVDVSVAKESTLVTTQTITSTIIHGGNSSTPLTTSTQVSTLTRTSVSFSYTTSTTTQTNYVTCSPLSQEGAVAIQPGQSLSAYILLTPEQMKYIAMLGVGSNYNYGGGTGEYSISAAIIV